MAQAKLVQNTLLTASGCSVGVSTAGACWVWKRAGGGGGGGGAVAAAQLVGFVCEGFFGATTGAGFRAGWLRNSSGGGGAAP